MSDTPPDKSLALHPQGEQRLLAALVASEGRYRQLVDSISDIVFELDEEGRIAFVNRAWTRHTGHAASDANDKPMQHFVHADDRGTFHSATERSDSPQLPLDLRIIDRRGQPIWFSLMLGKPEPGSAKLSGSLTYIHGRKVAEYEQRQQSRLLEALGRAQAYYIDTHNLGVFLDQLADDVGRLTGATRCQIVLLPGDCNDTITYNVPPWAAGEWLARLNAHLQSISHASMAGVLSTVTVPVSHPALLPAPDAFAEGLVLPVLSGARAVAALCVTPGPERPEHLAAFLAPVLPALAQVLRAEQLRVANVTNAALLERLSRVASQTSNSVIITDNQRRIQWVNEGFERTTGYALHEVLGLSPGFLLQGPDTDPDTVRLMREALENNRGFDCDVVNYRKSGAPFHLRIQCNPMLNEHKEQVGYMAIESDITAEKEWAAQILASEREKQMLLQEIHHRVKNNLQIVSSLLMLQVDQFTDSQTRLALEDSQRRVRSMALIHEHLYGTDSFASIEMADYTRALASQLQSMLSCNARLRIEATSVHIPMNTAIPMGLILNELLTNAFKYGLQQSTVAERQTRRTHLDDIVVEVGPHEQGVRIAVLDGGAGLSHNPLLQRSASLGLRLVQNLARQLRGAITYDSDLGSRFVLICPLDSGVPKSAPPAAG